LQLQLQLQLCDSHTAVQNLWSSIGIGPFQSVEKKILVAKGGRSSLQLKILDSL
jgi:hypothetical protein